MPVFDFSNDTSEIKEEVVCTYTTFSSNVDHATNRMPYPCFIKQERAVGSIIPVVYFPDKISRHAILI